MICLVCKDGIKEDDAVINCAECEVPYHKECWDYSLRCSVYGCNSLKVNHASDLFRYVWHHNYTDSQLAQYALRQSDNGEFEKAMEIIGYIKDYGVHSKVSWEVQCARLNAEKQEEQSPVKLFVGMLFTMIIAITCLFALFYGLPLLAMIDMALFPIFIMTFVGVALLIFILLTGE